MKELDLIENKDIREKMIGNVSVLEKVKDLLLLGNSEFATTQQVADYYEHIIDRELYKAMYEYEIEIDD